VSKRLIEIPRRGKRPGNHLSNLGATIGNWNDHRSTHDRRVDATLVYRFIDRIAGWLYMRNP
jgi:hypothetical protein